MELSRLVCGAYTDEFFQHYILSDTRLIIFTFELLLHARRGLWFPSSIQELSSFHLVDPKNDGVMMIFLSDM